MACWVLGALLRGGASIGDPLNGYTFVFYFSLRFRKIPKYAWPIKKPPGLF